MRIPPFCDCDHRRLTLPGSGNAGTQSAVKTQYVDYRDGDTPLSGYLAYDDQPHGQKTGRASGSLPGRTAGRDPARRADDRVDGLCRVRRGHFRQRCCSQNCSRNDRARPTSTTGIGPRMRVRARTGSTCWREIRGSTPDKIAVIGYCFGGTVAMELAETGVPAIGTVAVHGSFRDFQHEAARNIKGRVLILHGAEDMVAPLEEVNKLVGDLARGKSELGTADIQRRRTRIHQSDQRLRRARRPRVQSRNPALLQGNLRDVAGGA